MPEEVASIRHITPHGTVELLPLGETEKYLKAQVEEPYYGPGGGWEE